MPKPMSPCAKCLREMPPGWEACEHLENCWDKQILKKFGAVEEIRPDELAEFEQELIDYALNRMLALDRDNGNKAQGIQASRIYKSRNTRTSDLLAHKCHVRKGPVQCMRNAGHDGDHRF